MDERIIDNIKTIEDLEEFEATGNIEDIIVKEKFMHLLDDVEIMDEDKIKKIISEDELVKIELSGDKELMEEYGIYIDDFFSGWTDEVEIIGEDE